MDTPRPFDYHAFIEELTALAQQAKDVARDSDRMREAQAFKQWRLQLKDLLHRTRALDYTVNVDEQRRRFRADNPYEDRAVHQQAFEVDLDDTISEINLVLRNYKYYGVPLRKGEENKADSVVPHDAAPPALTPIETKSVSVEPPKPEKITMKWLWNHVPVSMVWWAGVSVLVVFASGFSAASLPIGQKVRAMFTEAPSEKSPK